MLGHVLMSEIEIIADGDDGQIRELKRIPVTGRAWRSEATVSYSTSSLWWTASIWWRSNS